jgi:cytochrome c-type biogenesis protein CcmF
MTLALGNAGIVLGALSCLAGIGLGVRAVIRHDARDARQLGALAALSLGGVVLSTVAMQVALLTNDTSVAYVAEHGSSRTPFPFDVATMWSALEGSILLWALLLAGFTALVARRFRARSDDPLVTWALVVMFVIGLFFYALMLGPARVFAGFDAPAGYDGPGPNPLLQNHILVAFHPPMLYLGYVGFSVPFAFAIAALITGRVGEGWLAETRRWTLFAWGFLTAGIVFGAWWSYEVSGWGGYWAWDPIENASLLPWLTGTAYLHSVMVQERRGMLRVWNLSLVCSTFSLTILGTFLARSGIVNSVHAFSSGGVGPALLGFFALVVIVSVSLIGWRGDRLRSPGAVDSPLSREAAFLANNLLFAAFAFVVFLGTVFPLVVEAVNNERISVGGPFFDRMTMPIGMVLLFLMAVAPVLPWRAASTELLSERLVWPAVLGVAGLGISVAVGARGPAPLLAFALGGFAAGSALRQLVIATRRSGLRGLVGRANGGMVVHLGVIVVAVALAASQSYVHQGEFSLAVGESVTVAGHDFTYDGPRVVQLANRREVRARIRIDDGAVYEPSMNHYVANGMAITRPSVKVTPTEDLYLNLTQEPSDGDGSIKLRIVIEPLILWLWIGGVVMIVGSALSAFPGRRRDPLAPVSSPSATEGTPESERAEAEPVG